MAFSIDQLNTAGRRNFEASIACMFLSGLAFVLRIYCKLAYKNGIRADDWWMLLTCLSAWVAGAVECWGNVTGGHGRNMQQLLIELLTTKNPGNIERYLLALWLSWVFYVLAACTVKISVLVFYRRIFISKTYQRVSLAITVVVTVWFIIAEALAMVACIPLDAFWNRLKVGKCMNSNMYTFGVGVIDALLDLVIVCLPLRMVFTLKIEMRTKVALGGIFTIGGMVVVTNLLRLRLMYQPNSIFLDYNNALLWSSIHLMTAHVCACLPIYKPLWQTIAAVVIAITSRFASNINTTFRTYVPRTEKPKARKTSSGTLNLDSERANLAKFKFQDTDTIESMSSGPTLVPPAAKGLMCVKIEGGNFTVDDEGWQIPDGTILYSRDYRVV